MAEQMRVTVTETIRCWPEADENIHHLPAARGDSWFVPVKCGGGITLPSTLVKVPRSEVCPDCLAGRVTLTEE